MEVKYNKPVAPVGTVDITGLTLDQALCLEGLLVCVELPRLLKPLLAKIEDATDAAGADGTEDSYEEGGQAIRKIRGDSK